jgi:sugar phosphate isomerase/epimerase
LPRVVIDSKVNAVRAEATRRQFLMAAGVGAAATIATGTRQAQKTPSIADEQDRSVEKGRSLRLAAASYTFRKFNLEETLAMTRRLGLDYICLKSFHLPLDSTAAQIEQATAKVKAAGLRLYGGGVIYMKSKAEVHRAFEYARLAGMSTIVGVPQPQLLSLVNDKVQQYDIKVAIHNHGPEDKLYPAPGTVYERIRQLDGRVGLCIDIGHTQRAGVDPSESAKKFADRLLDVHMKDVSAAAKKGRTVEIGRGVIDIPRFVGTLLDVGYGGIVSFEYEKDAKDPLAGVAESVGYVRGVLAAL